MAMNALRQHPLLFAAIALALVLGGVGIRSEEHTSELQSSQISYAVFCLKKKKEQASLQLEFQDPAIIPRVAAHLGPTAPYRIVPPILTFDAARYGIVPGTSSTAFVLYAVV